MGPAVILSLVASAAGVFSNLTGTSSARADALKRQAQSLQELQAKLLSDGEDYKRRVLLYGVGGCFVVFLLSVLSAKESKKR